MEPDSPGRSDPADSRWYSLKAGPPAAQGAPVSSVLRILQAKTKARLGVRLPEAQSESPGAVKVDPESMSLRDVAGRYQVVAEIGRGGVGVVFKGRDVDLGRDVALKVLREEFAQHPEVLARFVEEAQIGGQLQHPGIVPVYEIGLQNGEQPFIAMKLVKGETLAEQLAKRTDPTEDRRRLLGIFEQVCQTLAYAHARRVVHRDLKPGNVMIGAFGEVQVVDWGFAKVLPQPGERGDDPAQRLAQQAQVSVISTVRSQPSGSSHSVVGSMMGTPAYMPPEQALGDVEHMDQRSDVFGLGAILCEILTGRAVYLADDGDVIQQAARGDVNRAHARIEQCGADASLIALCKQCLSPSRLARPASAGEVAEQVGAYLTSVEERAREAQIRAAEAKVKARSTVLLAAAALAIVVLGGGGYAWVQSAAAGRRERASQRVAEATNEASGLLGQARAAGLQDLALWDRAVSASEQAELLAHGEDVDDGQRASAAELLAAARDERAGAQQAASRNTRDATMLQRLVEVRIPADENVRRPDWPAKEARRLDAAYADCFRDYLGGRELLTLGSDDALAALQEGAIKVDLAAALDHWALERKRLGNEPGALQQLAQRLDHDDAWRNDLRARLAQPVSDRGALETLAGDADFAALPATSLALLGRALRNAGATDAAIDVYSHGRRVHPADLDLNLQLGLTYESQDERSWDDAVACYRVSIALQPRLVVAWVRLGVVLHHQLHLDEAVACYRQALELDPADGGSYCNLGLALQWQGHLDEAVANYHKAIELDPTDPVAHNNLGTALQKQGRVNEAIASYNKAIELDPREAEAYSALGTALQEQGRLDEAIASYRTAIEFHPQDPATHNNLGLALQKQGHLDDALTSFRKAVALDPKLVLAHFALGVGLKDQGRWDEAIAIYRETIELDPEFALARLNLGSALAAQGHDDEAIASYRKAIELDPQLMLAHRNLGSALERQGQLDDAITSLRTAIELDPQDPVTYGNLAVALYQQGSQDEAIACLRRAIELDPNDAVSYSNLGNAVFLQGHLDEAVAAYRKAIELDPLLVEAHSNLGEALQEQGRWDEAIASCRAAVQLNPQFGLGHYTLAVALEHERQPHQALAEYGLAEQLLSAGHDPSSMDFAEKSRASIESLERQVAQEPVLLDILRGERDGASPQEWNDASVLAYGRKEYIAALGSMERAFAAQPQLESQYEYRYQAICYAALGGGEKGAEAGHLAEEQRATLRGKALVWLRAQLVAWRSDLEGADLQRQEAVERLKWSQIDEDLAGVRDEDALKLLPAEEAESWRALWREVAEQLARGDGQT